LRSGLASPVRPSPRSSAIRLTTTVTRVQVPSGASPLKRRRFPSCLHTNRASQSNPPPSPAGSRCPSRPVFALGHSAVTRAKIKASALSCRPKPALGSGRCTPFTRRLAVSCGGAGACAKVAEMSQVSIPHHFSAALRSRPILSLEERNRPHARCMPRSVTIGEVSNWIASTGRSCRFSRR
jgi:hypothetical protein